MRGVVAESPQEVKRQIRDLTSERSPVQLQLAAQCLGREAERPGCSDQIEEREAPCLRPAPVHERECGGPDAVEHVAFPKVAVHWRGSRSEVARAQTALPHVEQRRGRAVRRYALTESIQRSAVLGLLACAAASLRDLKEPLEQMALHPDPVDPLHSAARRQRLAVGHDRIAAGLYVTGVERLED